MLRAFERTNGLKAVADQIVAEKMKGVWSFGGKDNGESIDSPLLFLLQ